MKKNYGFWKTMRRAPLLMAVCGTLVFGCKEDDNFWDAFIPETDEEPTSTQIEAMFSIRQFKKQQTPTLHSSKYLRVLRSTSLLTDSVSPASCWHIMATCMHLTERPGL
ncbi:hypothetical protein [Dyadobacter sp.]|uniref:hypothetical protein n=1 Tax=Dyadobacter sp. TaxID=1914288 RepID=UPI003F72BF39